MGWILRRNGWLCEDIVEKVLKNAKLSINDLNTTLIKIERTVNNRSLTYAYDEVDEEMLTTAHLMCGYRFDMIPGDVKMKRTKLVFRKDIDIWKTEEGNSGTDGEVNI